MELSVWSPCLAASTGGKWGRVHPGNHRLAAEKLLGCWHPRLHRTWVNRQINICCWLQIKRREGKGGWGKGKHTQSLIIKLVDFLTGSFHTNMASLHRWHSSSVSWGIGAQDVNRKSICVLVCKMWMCVGSPWGLFAHVCACTLLRFSWPACMFAVTAVMTSSWRRVLMVRPPKTAPWWPLVAVSCCLRVSEDSLHLLYTIWIFRSTWIC